jgi:hypothetical protein
LVSPFYPSGKRSVRAKTFHRRGEDRLLGISAILGELRENPKSEAVKPCMKPIDYVFYQIKA